MICKDCNLDKSIDEFQFRKDTNKYRGNCRKCNVQRQMKWTSKNRERVNASYKKWIANNPLKKRAQGALNDAIRYGNMKRQGCERCLMPNAEAHHHDYSKPLDVIWLCKRHHEELHHV